MMSGRKKAIVNGFLIDGTGADPLENSIVLIEDTKIIAVGRKDEVRVPNDAMIIDAKEKTVMPGLIDLHVHLCTPDPHPPFPLEFVTMNASPSLLLLYAVRNVQKMLESGFTTVRDMDLGAWGFDGPSLSQALELGIVSGSRFVTTDQLTVVYLQRKYPLNVLEALVTQAHSQGKRVAAHAQTASEIENGVRVGVNTIEHGAYLKDVDVNIIQLMKEKNIILVPKCVEMRNHHLNVNLTKQIMKDHMKSFRKALELEVKIATGTDSLIGGKSAFELEVMVDYGMSEMDAIVASTKSGGEALGLEAQIGTIETGKLCDLIIVNKNPLNDIKILQDVNNIQMVLQNGNIVVHRGL